MGKTKIKKVHSNKKGKSKQAKKVSKDKKDFYLDLVSNTTYDCLKGMQYDDAFITKWQKQRMIRSLLFVFGGVLFYLLFRSAFLGGAVFSFGILLYVSSDRNVLATYERYRFNRALAFAKFTRLVFPYLKSDSNNGSESKIFTTLSSIVRRLDDPEDQRLLSQLLLDITENPNDKEPYTRYAEKVAGTDFARTFMETLYDIRQGGTNLSVIENLSRDSSDQIQRLTMDIIKAKERKLYNFLTMVMLAMVIPIIGTVGSMIFDSLGSIGGGLF